jgi:menaquinone-dependent protoporphyrinogen oxidase
MAETKLTMCPQTGERVEVALERSSLGLVVVGCTRFHPGSRIDCTRECVKPMDCMDRSNVDIRERVVIVLANLRDDAACIATKLVGDLAVDDLAVEVVDLEMRRPPPLADYDAVIIGARIRFGRHPRSIVNYVRDQREALATMPASFYSVGGHDVFDREGYLLQLTQRTGWRPTATAAFANADTIQRPAIREFAHHIADEIPATCS